MDRNTIIGFVLIFIIMMAWSWTSMPTPEELEAQRIEQIRQDSLAALQEQGIEPAFDDLMGADRQGQSGTSTFRDRRDSFDPLSTPTTGAFAPADGFTPAETRSTVRTPYMEIEFSSVGGGPASIRFLDYQTWDKKPVQMVQDTTRSAYNVGFLSQEGQNIETRGLMFEPLFETRIDRNLAEGESVDISYQYLTASGGRIIHTYTVYGDGHELDFDVQFEGLQTQIFDQAVDVSFATALVPTEKDLTQDGQYSSAYVFAGDELEQFQLTEGGRDQNRINGEIGWVSTRTKFFTQIIKPRTVSEAALLTGEVTGDPKEPLTRHRYQSSIQLDIRDTQRASMELYVGPLRYYDLREFDDHAYDMAEVGYSWMRWFSDPLVRFVIIPYFTFFSGWIGNYGVLIILFGVLVKLVLAPLTLSSFKSMAAMRKLQPEMQALAEKYKENPQKRQQETMKLYQKNKVNPIGGCLPMLLQFPILITLWQFFQGSILIRQESFLWAQDLSAPDYWLSLPFAIPFLGDQLAGFVLLMAGSIVLQTQLSGSMSSAPTSPGMPNMKVMMYIMPFMLLFFFNNFAAGLSLYYLVFNVLSAGQQWLINRGTIKETTPALATVSTKNRSKKSSQKSK